MGRGIAWHPGSDYSSKIKWQRTQEELLWRGRPRRSSKSASAWKSTAICRPSSDGVPLTALRGGVRKPVSENPLAAFGRGIQRVFVHWGVAQSKGLTGGNRI